MNPLSFFGSLQATDAPAGPRIDAPATRGFAGAESAGDAAPAGTGPRRRLELAAFPAVFLTLMGAPVEASEVALPPPAFPVGVPGEDAEPTLDLLAATAAALVRDLEALDVAGAAEGAADFAEMYRVIDEARRAPRDDEELAWIGADFRAALAVHAEIVAAVTAPRAATEAPRALEAAADSLEGWGFLPDFRDRLQRVVDRMRSEHGHEVRVIEGYRAQHRQDDLWMQGRSRPGPVVTWTQDSRHTAGAAADLLIDGEWAQGRPALLLARIAEEEGLRTLAPRDPAHIELPGDLETLKAEARRAGVGRDLDGARLTLPGGEPVESESRSAQGRVARPAPVARVAPVAPVARPGGSDSPAPPTPDLPPAPPAPEVAEAMMSEGEPSTGEYPVGGDAPTPGRDGHTPARAEAPAGTAAPTPGPIGDGGVTRWVREVGSSTPGLEMLRRIDQVEGAATRSLVRRVMIALDGADQNPIGHVRLDVRGDRVDALFDVNDTALAHRLERDLAALRSQLTAEGVDPGRLRVRHAGAEVAIAAEARSEPARTLATTPSDRPESGAEGHGRESRERELREEHRNREGRPAPRDTTAEEDDG